MKIKKVVNKNLRSIVSFEIADGRIFGATGRRIIELDSDLNRVSEYNGCYYTTASNFRPTRENCFVCRRGIYFTSLILKLAKLKRIFFAANTAVISKAEGVGPPTVNISICPCGLQKTFCVRCGSIRSKTENSRICLPTGGKSLILSMLNL